MFNAIATSGSLVFSQDAQELTEPYTKPHPTRNLEGSPLRGPKF